MNQPLVYMNTVFRSLCGHSTLFWTRHITAHINYFHNHPLQNIILSLCITITFNLSLLSVVWQPCSWTDQDSEAQARYQFVSIWRRVHRSHAQCWMDCWQWLGWAKSDAISKLVSCSIVLSISLCFGGKLGLIVDTTSKRDYILTTYVVISGGSLQSSIQVGPGPRFNPLPFGISFWQKRYRYPVCIPLIEKKVPLSDTFITGWYCEWIAKKGSIDFGDISEMDGPE